MVDELLRGEPLDAVSREVGVEVYRLERWKARALAGLELGLKEQAGELRISADLEHRFRRKVNADFGGS